MERTEQLARKQRCHSIKKKKKNRDFILDYVKITCFFIIQKDSIAEHYNREIMLKKPYQLLKMPLCEYKMRRAQMLQWYLVHSTLSSLKFLIRIKIQEPVCPTSMEIHRTVQRNRVYQPSSSITRKPDA